jgi:hypothetical protein
MCRNIKKLRYDDRQPTQEELNDAALQFVRKISGYKKPSKANQEAFEKAVVKITKVSQELFENINI